MGLRRNHDILAYKMPMPHVNSSKPGRVVLGVLLGIGALVLVLVAGSYLYWLGDGMPGTPAEFREQVADGGLIIEWTNSGPRAGSGTVETGCGPVAVDVDELEDGLWIRWEGHRRPLTPEAIDLLTSCAP